MILRILFVFLLALSGFYGVCQTGFSAELQRSKNQWLLQLFQQRNPEAKVLLDCPPNLRTEIPATSKLDESLHPFAQDRELEAACIRLYFSENCEGFSTLRMLGDLYFPLFERHLHARGLEEDFKYLPVVLSALNSAFDDHKNHAGLWGLDFPSARSAGLRVDELIDERKAPDLATQAAVSLLKSHYDRYDGDPLQTVVAYLRGVHYADRFQAANISTDPELRWQLTMLHVSIRLFKHTEAEHHLLDWLKILSAFEAVPVTQDLEKRALTELLSLDLSLIDGLNPTYQGARIPANYRNVPFLLPEGSLDAFYHLEDSLYCYRPPLAVEEAAREAEAERVPEGDVTYYTVRSGDVLGKIARRFGVRVSDLKRWNKLRSDRIDIGQELLIYGGSLKSDEERNSATEASKSSELPPKGEYIIHTVQSGESLWLIARKYPGVSADNIMEWNHIDEDIQPGQQLKIYEKQ